MGSILTVPYWGMECTSLSKCESVRTRTHNISANQTVAETDRRPTGRREARDERREKEERMQSIQQKLAKAEEYKAEGNLQFKEGNYSRAKANYGKCLAYCTGLAGSARNKTGYESFQKVNPDVVGVTDEEEAVASQLELICHQNIATCFLKMKAPADALTHCNKALKLGGQEGGQGGGRAWKAQLRKGEAFLQLGRHDDAQSIFENLLATTTDEAAAAVIKKQLTIAKKMMKAHITKEKQRYKNMFSDSTDSKQHDQKEEAGSSAASKTAEQEEESRASKLQKMIEKEFNGK